MPPSISLCHYDCPRSSFFLDSASQERVLSASTVEEEVVCDPSRSCDCTSSETSLNPPESKQKLLLWRYSSPEETIRRRIQPSKTSLKGAGAGGAVEAFHGVQRKKDKKKKKRSEGNIKRDTSHEAEAEEEEEASIGNSKRLQTLDDTSQPRELVGLLQMCSKQKDLERGSKLHAYVDRTGLLERNIYIGSALLHMYAECGVLGKAQEVFAKLPVKNVISWTALITGYTKHGHGKQALKCFEQMQSEGFPPNAITYIYILKACGSIRAADKGKELHDEIVRKGLLKKDVALGTAVVDMYAKCGLLAKAQEVFDNLMFRDVISWVVLITGYTQNGYGRQALQCFEQMQCEGLSPNKVIYICILKACGSIGAIDKGKEVHTAVVREGLLEMDVIVGNALVDMYAKCCLLVEAQEVFDRLPFRDVVSWGALIAGYAQHGHGMRALECFKQLQSEGLSPDASTCVCALKACGSVGALDKGKEIHDHIVREGFLENNSFVGNALLDMYVKCGSLAKAQELFDKFPVQDVVSWSVLIAGYTQHGYGEQALECFDLMQLQGISPDAVTFACTLKACGLTGAADKGKEIHANIVKEGILQQDVVVATSLVDMYVKCGLLTKAQEVFDQLAIKNVVLWSALMVGYVQQGNANEALNCFEQMQREGFFPDAVTFACILKVCGSIGAVDKGIEIQAAIAKQGSFQNDIDVCNALVEMYAKCGLLTKAQEVFEMIPVRDLSSWNALMAGYIQQGCVEQAVECFKQMQFEGLSPDVATFINLLKGCGSIGAVEKGRELHAKIVREGLLEKDMFVGAALVSMYIKCSLLAEAQEVSDKLPIRNVVSWSILISGYAEYGYNEQALNCFERMQMEGFSPDAVTFVYILKVCGSMRAVEKGKVVHAEIVREGLLKTDVVVGNALVDMYVKCGLPAKAQEVFDNLPIFDVVTWSVLMAGYIQHGYDDQALKCFEQLKMEGLSLNAATSVCILKACGSIGAVNQGKEIHAKIQREGLLKEDIVVGNALIDMYAKCGLLVKAQEVFDELPNRDVVSWSVLMAGYALFGLFEHVFKCFDKMLKEGAMPNLVTFTIVLNTCCHAGLVDKGEMYFEAMCSQYGIMPSLQHYTCMIDLFASAGHLDKAIAVIKQMPFSTDVTLWLTVLGACQKWGHLHLAKLAFQHAVQLNEEETAAYICLSNTCVNAGRQEDFEAVRVAPF